MHYPLGAHQPGRIFNDTPNPNPSPQGGRGVRAAWVWLEAENALSQRGQVEQ